MKQSSNITRFILGAVAALLLSAGFAQAAERLDYSLNPKDLTVNNEETVGDPRLPNLPCIGPDRR